jgi:phenylalanyl-tRNA synthetase beta chain
VRVLVSWLRDFVDVPGTAEEIARTMSTRGFAVEAVEPTGEGDAVIDFEVTANRPDCMSVMGIAREVATAYRLQVRRPVVHGQSSVAVTESGGTTGPALQLVSLKSVEKSDIDVVIESPNLCPRYAGAVADVRVMTSPDWMRRRLLAAGIRPISNIVDVTNYVLLELGHPMHAFDLTKVGGAQIRVRTAKSGEMLRTLDGRERELDSDILIIADAERPVAIAGIMGGADSEVGDSTTAIVLESAYFNPQSVRRTSKRLGLKTEASIRFERGADPRLPVTAMERACALLEAIGAGKTRGTVVDRYPVHIGTAVLRLRRQKIRGLLGTEIPDTDVRRIFESLGFALRDAPDGWDVTVPTRRVDVTREVDLIEEAARHYGFDRLPVTFPALTAAPPPPDPRILRARHLRHVLTAAGFSEAVTFGFMAEEPAVSFVAQGELVPIANPLSETFAVLRPSALPGLLDAVAHNRRREQRDVRLFEVGARFSRSAGENQTLACAWTGAATGGHWSGAARDVDFFDIKGLVERICEALGIAGETGPGGDAWLVPGRAASVMVNGTPVACMGQLAPAVAESHGLNAADAVYVAEIDLDACERVSLARPFRAEPLPRYPSATRDIAILVDESLAAARLRETIRSAAPETLVRVREFDRYQGKGVPEGKLSLALRLTFRSLDRTLTDAEVQTAMDAVLAALKEKHGAIQR